MKQGLSKMGWMAAGSVLCSSQAFANSAPTVDRGDTAWVLASAALVLLMTPGLAFFYAGMVRSKNVVSTLFQNFATLSVVGVLWAVVGYSLAFGPTHGGFIGSLDWILLKNVGQTPNPEYAATIPHLAFMIFQCMFAIIAPALITGSIAERIRFKAWIAFAALWSLCIYVPVAHWVWAVGGWLRNFGALDFAGGFVVHMTAGYSAVVAAIFLGKRKDFGQAIRPYDTGMVMLGTGLLWFGWFGFNAGSALAANGLAAQAFVSTFFGAAAASVAWVIVDTFVRKKPNAMGAAIAAVVGLIAVTPASGFVGAGSALLIGLVAGTVCNVTASLVKERFRLDDSLDVFACHGVGATIGSILTPVFASKAINDAGVDGLIYGGSGAFGANLLASAVVIVVSVAGTYAILKFLSLFMTLRVSEEEEEHGLDLSQHAEFINSALTSSIPSQESAPSKKKDRVA